MFHGLVLRIQTASDMQRAWRASELHDYSRRCGWPKSLEYKSFVEFIYGKLVGDKGYIDKNLFERLFVDGIQLITKLKSNMKGSLIPLSDKLLLRKRAIIETVNDELKNIAQVEHSRHRAFDNFIVNLLSGIATYCCFPKKPCINVSRTVDTQLALFWIRRTHVKITILFAVQLKYRIE